MKETLIPGLVHQSSHLVTKAMAPGHLSMVVLSTPDMIRLIEFTCHDGVLSHLDDGETTVGTHVCVSHSGAAYENEEVSVTTRLAKVERRRLTFGVEVHSPRGQISAGTHERAVLDTSRFSAGR
ncbi:MAG: thioesterase family protein [Acidimicrobiia bacterium]